jgi:hypothetical protein
MNTRISKRTTETVLAGADTQQKTITHNSKWEKPKYGSQSETTIDSCL